MRNIIQKDIENHAFGLISLFDEQFSFAVFSESIQTAEHEADSVLAKAKLAVEKAVKREDDDYKLVVDLDDDTKNKLKSGEVELVMENGKAFAQLRGENKKYGKKLSVTEELADEGVTSEALQTAIQMEAIKKQLETIVERMKDIEEHLADVIHGQRNDRIGLFYSGLSLYAEACSVEDEFLKKQLVAQSLRSISDANSQMIQEIRQCIAYLVNEQYKSTKQKVQKIEEHLSAIRQCYDIVFRAAFLKAWIYQQNGEIRAMVTAIDEYGRFIEKLVVPYAGKLSELDSSDRFIKQGTWGQIASTLSSCQEMKKTLGGVQSYCFILEGEQNGERQ